MTLELLTAGLTLWVGLANIYNWCWLLPKYTRPLMNAAPLQEVI